MWREWKFENKWEVFWDYHILGEYEPRGEYGIQHDNMAPQGGYNLIILNIYITIKSFLINVIYKQTPRTNAQKENNIS